jgi:hypothetical protein
METNSQVLNSIKYKYKIYEQRLILTTSNQEMAKISDIFIKKFVGYKPEINFIFNYFTNLKHLCPMINIFKALICINHHSFKLNSKIGEYLNQAVEGARELLNFGVKIEPWEESWIDIINIIVNKKPSDLKEKLLEHSKKYTFDIMAFKYGMVMGLYSGSKEYMKNLAEIYSGDEENFKDANFLGTLAFIYEELGNFKQSESIVKIGLKLDETSIWLQHVNAHIMYQTDRVEESIIFLENKKHLWRENSNNFLFKHIKWHLAVAYLEQEEFEKSLDIIKEIIEFPFEESECLLAIFGFIVRLYIRLEGSIENTGIHKWDEKILSYLNNLEIYTSHLLFDILAIWYLTKMTHTEYSQEAIKILENAKEKIQENISNSIISSETKTYFENTYINLIKALSLFAEGKYNESFKILNSEEQQIWKIGASDEQLIVLFEIELYCAYKTSNFLEFNRIKKEIFGDQLSNLKYIIKFQKNLSI